MHLDIDSYNSFFLMWVCLIYWRLFSLEMYIHITTLTAMQNTLFFTEMYVPKIMLYACTHGCHYNMVQYNMIFHMAYQSPRQNINLSFNSQKKTQYLTFAMSYGVSIVEIFEKIDCLIMTPLQINVTGPFWLKVNIVSGIGLVPSGNKPLSKPMLTQIYVIIWHHWATMS